MSYLTVDELKQHNVISDISSCDEDTKLEALISYCSSLIDAYVGFSFTTETDKTINVDGSGTKIITLPQRIYNITDVQDTDSEVVYDLSNLVIVNNNYAIRNKVDEFDEGDYNIEVTGDFGWDKVPDDVINCLIILCNGNFDNLTDEDVLKHQMSPFSSEKIGNYSYQIKNQNNPDDIETTGNPFVDKILDKYKGSDFYIGVI